MGFSPERRSSVSRGDAAGDRPERTREDRRAAARTRRMSGGAGSRADRRNPGSLDPSATDRGGRSCRLGFRPGGRSAGQGIRWELSQLPPGELDQPMVVVGAAPAGDLQQSGCAGEAVTLPNEEQETPLGLRERAGHPLEDLGRFERGEVGKRPRLLDAIEADLLAGAAAHRRSPAAKDEIRGHGREPGRRPGASGEADAEEPEPDILNDVLGLRAGETAGQAQTEDERRDSADLGVGARPGLSRRGGISGLLDSHSGPRWFARRDRSPPSLSSREVAGGDRGGASPGRKEGSKAVPPAVGRPAEGASPFGCSRR